MGKANIVLVETNQSNINHVIADIGIHIGVHYATTQVKKWFDDYTSFVYDVDSGDLLFYFKRYTGYWEADNSKLNLYRK